MEVENGRLKSLAEKVAEDEGGDGLGLAVVGKVMEVKAGRGVEF